jgi:hypothetical protein
LLFVFANFELMAIEVEELNVEAIYCNRRALDGLLVAFFLGDVVNI